MKQKLLQYSLLICLSGLLACFSACSRKDEPAPAPSSTAASPAIIANAKKWFRQQTSATSAKTGTATRDEDNEQPSINWTQAILLDEHLVAPFADTTHTFNKSHQYGYRFLVVGIDQDCAYAGRIVELITAEQPASTEAAAAVALAGTEPLLNGQQPGPIVGFTGTLLAYSPGYEYETGLAYQEGAVQPLHMRIDAPTARFLLRLFFSGLRQHRDAGRASTPV